MDSVCNGQYPYLPSQSMVSSSNDACLGTLPAIPLLEVFSKVSKKDRFVLARVCRRFRDLLFSVKEENYLKTRSTTKPFVECRGTEFFRFGNICRADVSFEELPELLATANTWHYVEEVAHNATESDVWDYLEELRPYFKRIEITIDPLNRFTFDEMKDLAVLFFTEEIIESINFGCFNPSWWFSMTLLFVRLGKRYNIGVTEQYFYYNRCYDHTVRRVFHEGKTTSMHIEAKITDSYSFRSRSFKCLPADPSRMWSHNAKVTMVPPPSSSSPIIAKAPRKVMINGSSINPDVVRNEFSVEAKLLYTNRRGFRSEVELGRSQCIIWNDVLLNMENGQLVDFPIPKFRQENNTTIRLASIQLTMHFRPAFTRYKKDKNGQAREPLAVRGSVRIFDRGGYTPVSGTEHIILRPHDDRTSRQFEKRGYGSCPTIAFELLFQEESDVDSEEILERDVIVLDDEESDEQVPEVDPEEEENSAPSPKRARI